MIKGTDSGNATPENLDPRTKKALVRLVTDKLEIPWQPTITVNSGSAMEKPVIMG
jgi:hypothetical protein